MNSVHQSTRLKDSRQAFKHILEHIHSVLWYIAKHHKASIGDIVLITDLDGSLLHVSLKGLCHLVWIVELYLLYFVKSDVVVVKDKTILMTSQIIE